ncbi:MAG: permease [Nanoarchaeota archaeon]|nr:permease [Nanoarchaeota archaeon]
MKKEACSHCESTEDKKIKIGKKLKIFGVLFIIIFLISFHPFFNAFNKSLLSYLKIIWWAVLLGLLIGGVIDYFVPEEFIFKFLGGRKKRNLFYAVLAGFLMSACSHGILAISMQLYKKGAGIPAVITFLLAAPWANLPITILMFGFFGIKALLFIGAAMAIALITGFIYMSLEKAKWIEQSLEIKGDGKIVWDKVKNFNFSDSIFGVTKGSVELANMVLWWLLIGIMVAALIGAYVPAHWFMKFLGPSFVGLLLTLAFATIIEVCSEGSAPIAFEIFNKVGTFGNPFVFLMAGVVTDYTEIGLIWSNIGKKSAIWLPIITVPLVLLAGWLFNLFL